MYENYSRLYVRMEIEFNGIRNDYELFSASLTTSIFALAASYAECNEVLVAILLSISLTGHSFDVAGTELNAFDLGPNYVGPITSLVFTVATGTALIAPYTAGVLVPNVNS